MVVYFPTQERTKNSLLNVVKESAILDANVLGSRMDRNLLFAIADANFFVPLFSLEIFRETEKRTLPNIIANKNEIPRIMKGIKEDISIRFPQSMVKGYESIDPGFELQDHKDMHVVKAAVHSGASVIISKDRDFSNQILNHHNLNALTPDDFIEKIITPESISIAVNAIRYANEKLFVKRPYDFEEFTGLLKSKYGMHKVAKLLEDNRDLW